MAAKKQKSSAKSPKKAAGKPVSGVPAVKEVSLKERAVSAALSLSATLGWDLITMTDIADETGASLAELSDLFDDKGDILTAYGRMIDREMLKAAGTPDNSVSERDRLFDIIMTRFDVVNRDRAAVVSILHSFRADPKQAVISLPHLGRSMAWVLEAAGIEANGFKGAARLAGLTAVYVAVTREWLSDDSADMAKTMAALDKNLERAERAANFLSL
ncbi:MAG: TetR family transcriptional regulator [Micavibrio aeruginosavorus]|uniref:TetR family transcriptional regulator n=1 Tax=Micavibrio aeruginosavorus TaxID=349221 RepID=A0A2W5BXF4_9BACT|nr:MAG: TetR family transcriptional regulator [Micavibrio aeruginosavorus]